MYQRNLSNWQRCRYLLTVLLYCQVGIYCSADSHIGIEPPKPATGESVLLLVYQTGELYNVNWYSGQGTSDRKNVLTHSPGSPYPPTKGPLYTGRETVMDNGTLEISDLLTNYSGFYTVEITTPRGLQHWTTELIVYHGSGCECSSPKAPAAAASSSNYTPAYIQPSPARNSSDYPDFSQPNQSKVSEIVFQVGIAVGVAVVIGLIILVVIICKKKYFKKSKEPTYDEAISSLTIQQNSTYYEEILHPTSRHLPSVPPRIDISNYQNSSRNETTNNTNEITKGDENPYTDLNYLYLSSAYEKLRRENQ